MGIELKDGTTTYVGESSTRFFQMRVMLSALKLELKGIKVRRGYSAWASAKKMYNLKGNKQKVHDALEKLVNEEAQRQEIVDLRTRKTPEGEVHGGGSQAGG